MVQGCGLCNHSNTMFAAQSLDGCTFITGVLSSLSSLFKHGKREDLVQYGMVCSLYVEHDIAVIFQAWCYLSLI